MSKIGDLVSKCCDLSIGAVALASGDPSGGQLAASALGGLGSIGIGMWANCEDRTRDRAMKRTIARLRQSGDFTEDALTEAIAVLKDKEACPIEPSRLSGLAAESNLAKGGAAYLVAQMQPAPDLGTADILRTALEAGIETCMEDQAFLQKLTFEFVRDVARGQGVELAILERLEAKFDDLPQQIADLLRQQGLVSDTGGVSITDLQSLAAKFGETGLRDAGPLLSFLESKAEEYRTYKAEIEAIDERVKGLGNLKAAAREAADRLDFEEVETLLSHVQSAELEIAAETAELRARNALLRGKVEQAYTILSAAADSFAAVDLLEPARRRQTYQDLFFRHGNRYSGEAHKLMEQMVRQVLAVADKSTSPELWANAQNSLAIALRNQGSRAAGTEGAALLGSAVDSYRAALRVRTEADHPVDWAMTMQNLGVALQNQGSRTAGPKGAALLAEAVESYRAALRVRTEADYPVQWAMAMQNLGNTLAQQGTRTAGPEGAALLAEAVESYRAALRVSTEADHPVIWATTMQNLGNALQQQGSRTAGPEGGALLAEAVESFRAALRVRTEADHPVDWAMTMQNLGGALAEQGTRTAGPEGAALLEEAVASFRAARKVNTKADIPVEWAKNMENMAMLEEARADHDTCTDPRTALEAGLAHVEAALTVYDPEHMPYDYGTATKLRDRLHARLEQFAAEEK